MKNNMSANKNVNFEISSLAKWHHNNCHCKSSEINSRIAKLTEEVGELVQAINKGHSTIEIAGEIGDAINTLIAISEIYDVSIASCLSLTVDKLHSRYEKKG